MVFNAQEHLMRIGRGEDAKDYLPVAWRLVWFREVCPEGTVETELVHLDLDRETQEEGWQWNAEKKRNEKVIKTGLGLAIFKATVKDGKGGIGTGTKSEKAASFPDWLEKAETGSIGRALAALGYGTQFAPEWDEEHRIVDSPQQNGNIRKPPLTLEAVKEQFIKAYQIKPENKEEKWKAYIVHVLGLPVTDEGLSDIELQKLRKAIEEHTTQAKP